MTTTQLFPKPRKQMRQPRKDIMRDELRRAADRIIAKELRIAFMREAINECGVSVEVLEKSAKKVGSVGFNITPEAIAELHALRRPWWRRINWRKMG